MLSYSEYVNLGGNLDEKTFSRFCYRAERIITNYTFGRISGITDEDIIKAVNMCEFELIDFLSSNNDGGITRIISSVGNDGYSESYSDGNISADEQIYDIVYTYLIDTGLMCCGVNNV